MATTLPTFDRTNTNHVTRQLSAVTRFSEHLIANRPAHMDSDTAEGVRTVLKAFRLELERLRDNAAPTREYVKEVSWSRNLAVWTIERLLDANPALHGYDPSIAAKTIEEVTLNLLAHALKAFGDLPGQ